MLTTCVAIALGFGCSATVPLVATTHTHMHQRTSHRHHRLRRSWREFPHPDEEDVEQAENREHARYIKRYNAKLRERAKKEEKARLKEFVEAAFKRDPRVIAHKEAEKAKRCVWSALLMLFIGFMDACTHCVLGGDVAVLTAHCRCWAT